MCFIQTILTHDINKRWFCMKVSLRTDWYFKNHWIYSSGKKQKKIEEIIISDGEENSKMWCSYHLFTSLNLAICVTKWIMTFIPLSLKFWKNCWPMLFNLSIFIRLLWFFVTCCNYWICVKPIFINKSVIMFSNRGVSLASLYCHRLWYSLMYISWYKDLKVRLKW